MKFDIKDTIEHIKSNPLFQRLKDVIENIDGWHDHESVYDHLIKTLNHAEEFSNGNFITNQVAKNEFISWMREDFHSITRQNITLITALTHDCGKVLYYEEGSKKESINLQKNNGQTNCPGHEYWGGKLVAPELLKDVNLSPEIKYLISEVIKVHAVFSDNYFSGKKDWIIDQIISNVKAGANGYYIESLFNQYVDCYDAPAFEYGIQKIEELFNNPSFYIPRKYFIQ